MTAELETTNPTPDVESERNGEDTPAVQAAKPKRSHHKMPSTQPLDPEQIGKIQQRNRSRPRPLRPQFLRWPKLGRGSPGPKSTFTRRSRKGSMMMSLTRSETRCGMHG